MTEAEATLLALISTQLPSPVLANAEHSPGMNLTICTSASPSSCWIKLGCDPSPTLPSLPKW